MKLNLFVSVAAVLCLTWPAAVLADPPSDQGHAKAQDQGQAKGQGQVKGQARGQGQGQGQARGQGQGQIQGQTRGQGHGYGQGQGQGQIRGQTMGQGQGQIQGLGQGQVRRQVRQPQTQLQTGQQGYRGTPGATAVQTQRDNKAAANHRPSVAVAAQPPANVPALSGWRRGVTGAAQVQAGQQWRQQHSGWDSRAVWRQNPNWWRGNSGFRLWSGVRIGFFFIPDFGYVSVPAEYRARHWRGGDYLPNWFWRYPVRDFWNYGLPRPPDGCGWVWVNNDVALIDLDNGYILDIEHHIW